MNQDKIIAFKNKLEQDCKDLLDAPIDLFDPKPWDQHFSGLFKEYQEQFYIKLEASNMQAFD